MMRKIPLLFLLTLLFSCTVDRDFETLSDLPDLTDPDFELIHYWNFNNNSNNTTLISPTVGNGSLSYLGADFDSVDEGTTINARNNDASGSALRLRNPSGDFILSLPTVGYEKVIFSYATTRTNNGPQEQTLSYSIDGENFTTAGLTNNQLGVTTDFLLRQFDFSQIEGVNNNPNFKIKIAFNINADGESGNSRFDNITVDAVPIEGFIPGDDDDDDPIDPEMNLFLYWNFNNDASNQTLITPTLGSGSLTYLGSYFDSIDEGSEINARNEDPAGSALRLRNPSGDFIIAAPTSGYEDVVFTYATTRTNNGPQQQSVFYTLDGTNYTNSGLSQTINMIDTEFVKYQYNFSGIEGVNDNANFKIKIQFDINASGESGNSRFDNITFDGIQIEGSDPDPDPDPDPTNLLHYWNFNNTSSTQTLLTPSAGVGVIEYSGNFLDSSPDGSSLNTQNNDPAGAALRLRNPMGDLMMSLPTTNYENLVLKMATARTQAGAQQINIFYTLNGIDYTNASLPVSQITISEEYVLHTLDFSTIPQVNNNPNFKVKFEFDINNTGNSGSIRFDNITLEGDQL